MCEGPTNKQQKQNKMKKFVIMATEGQKVEELAVVTLPACTLAHDASNWILITVPDGTAEAMAHAISSLMISDTVVHWNSSEHKVEVNAIGCTKVKLIETAGKQELLFTKETVGVNGYKVVTPVER